MFRPLQSIKDLMGSFSAHLERWAYRIKVRMMNSFVVISGDECVLGFGIC